MKLFTLASAVAISAYSHNALADTLHIIDLKRYPLATCLDGSPGAFYFWKATSAPSQQKWVIHHVGGGWCSTDVPDTQMTTVDSCYHRSATSLGSSAPSFYPRNASVGWTIWGYDQSMIADPAQNPLMHDWNKVALVYCDGGSFSGRNSTPTQTKDRTLHFHGSYIREAVMGTLLDEYGLKSATDVVITGASAGGLSTYLHVDQWRHAIPESAFLVGLADGGFFLDWSLTKPAQSLNSYAHELRSDFFAFNASAGVNGACVAARATVAGDVSDCYFAEHTLPFIKSPIFALQSTVDAWQLPNELGTTADATLINEYRVRSISRLQETLLADPKHGGFIDSCMHHCGMWDNLVVDGWRAADAFVAWYAAQRASWQAGTVPQSMAWWQGKKWPCTECCGTSDTVIQGLDVPKTFTYASRLDDLVTV